MTYFTRIRTYHAFLFSTKTIGMSEYLIKAMTLVCLWMNCTESFGQAQQVNGQSPPTFASPNAASLGKYGDIPVSYHTGTVDISVPIFTVKQGSLSLPITLSYHSSGIRVSELASWVGLGWSLNAGGMVTRTIHGGPDDDAWSEGTYATSDLGKRGWYGNGGVPSQLINCQNSTSFLGSLQQSKANGPNGVTINPGCGCACWDYYWDASQGYLDVEPDLYTFNFNGYTGKFFFDASAVPHVMPEQDVQIKPIFMVSNSKRFDGFEITTPDGFKYSFGGSGATEITKNDMSGAAAFKDPQTSTTWYLYRIMSPNGEDQINLTYTDENYSFGNRGGHSVVVDALGGVIGTPAVASSIPGISLVSPGKRLTQITTSSGETTINFTANTLREDLTSTAGLQGANNSAMRLDRIDITSSQVCKRFTLSYAYFISSVNCPSCPVEDFDTKRLQLKSVQESDCLNSVVVPPYVFTYNSTPLPRRYSLARDGWDYYNGADGNTGLISSDIVNPITGMPLGSANRTVTEDKMQAGILTQVSYPTGGSSSFVYEAHRRYTGSPIIGGIRVKKITTIDANGTTLTRSIAYDNGNLYAGTPTYLQYPDNNNQKTATLQFGIVVASSPVTSMWSSQGYHIGYGNVTETQLGNGSVTYSYMNSNAIGIPDNSKFPVPELIAGMGTSDQVQKDYYLQGSSTALRTEQSSKGVAGMTSYITARKVTNINCIGTGDCILNPSNNLYTDYSVAAYRFLLNGSNLTADSVTTATAYEYSTTLNVPTAMTITDSKGVVERTEWDYPSASNAPPEMYDKTNANYKNMVDVPVEQRKYRNGTLVERVTNTYTATTGNVFMTKHRVYPSGGTNYFDTDYTYYANSKRLSSVLDKSGIVKSYVWDNINNNVIAEVTNATPDKIFHTSFEDQTSNVSTDAKTGRLSYTAAYTVTLPSAGTYVLTYWSKSGGTWTYNKSTISAATIIGGSGVLIDEVRLYPQGALMTTYTYDNGVGVTTVTDPNGRSTYYGYDKLIRLRTIQDTDRNILKQYKYNYKLSAQ